MSVAPDVPPMTGGNDQPGECAVCGTPIEDEGNIEDSSGWRWFSDGRGGLLPLCPTCPAPADVAGAY